MLDLLQFKELLPKSTIILQEKLDKFINIEVKPIINEAYEKAIFPENFLEKIANLNILGATLPKSKGGQNADYLTYGIICQELERGDSSLRTFVSVQSSLCMYPIFKFGSDAQHDNYLKNLGSGKSIGCFALTEPGSGSDPSSMQTIAKPVSGGWHLTGHKQWITHATIADIGIIWARIPDQGIRGFIVDLNSKGVKRKLTEHKLSLRASVTGELIFDRCFIPQENILIGTEKGLSTALACLNQARYGIAWGAIGAAQDCLDTAINYTKSRHQFNKPLASFQLVQKDLVDCYTEITKAQILNYRLSQLMEANTAQPAFISMAKSNACHHALNIARKTRALLGANGISLDNDIIRHITNLETLITYEGTENVHTLIIGKELTGENAFF